MMMIVMRSVSLSCLYCHYPEALVDVLHSVYYSLWFVLPNKHNVVCVILVGRDTLQLRYQRFFKSLNSSMLMYFSTCCTEFSFINDTTRLIEAV
jgi:hypothetical protein